MAMDGSNILSVPGYKKPSIHSLAANLGFHSLEDLASLTYSTFRNKSPGIKNIPEGFGYAAATRVILQVLFPEEHIEILKKHHKTLGDNPSGWTMMFSHGKEETYPEYAVSIDITSITGEQLEDIRRSKAFLVPDLDFSALAKVYLYYPGKEQSIFPDIPERYCEAVSDILFGYRHADPLVLLDPHFRAFQDKYPNHPAVRSAMEILKEKNKTPNV